MKTIFYTTTCAMRLISIRLAQRPPVRSERSTLLLGLSLSACFALRHSENQNHTCFFVITPALPVTELKPDHSAS